MELTKTLLENHRFDCRKLESRAAKTGFSLSASESAGSFGNFFDQIFGSGEGLVRDAGSGPEAHTAPASRAKPGGSVPDPRARPAVRNAARPAAGKAAGADSGENARDGKNGEVSSDARISRDPSASAAVRNKAARRTDAPADGPGKGEEAAEAAKTSVTAGETQKDAVAVANAYILWGVVPAAAAAAETSPADTGAAVVQGAETVGAPEPDAAGKAPVKTEAAGLGLDRMTAELVAAYAEADGIKAAGDDLPETAAGLPPPALPAKNAPTQAQAVRAAQIPLPAYGAPPESPREDPVFDDTAIFLSADVEYPDAQAPEQAEAPAVTADAPPLRERSEPENQIAFADYARPASAPDGQKPARSGARAEAPRGADAADAVRQIMDKLKLEGAPAGNASEVRIRLRPESLGEVSMKIASDNGAVTAQFVAESQRVKEVIEAGFERLRESLARQGLEVTRLAVSVDPDGQMSRFLREQRSARSQARKISGVGGVSGISGGPAEAEAVDARENTAVLSAAGTDGLDLLA
ncbi:MAG: flagellar hook-length control protein FliK [Firmicutes bacterium]|nr:flagellar hook-length control protein FliK [Bacillota bacterium]